jgi:hypothetical protein
MGNATPRVRRFLLRRKTSIVKIPFMRSAEYVTPQRMGGRVAPTKSMSAWRPVVSWLIATP